MWHMIWHGNFTDRDGNYHHSELDIWGERKYLVYDSLALTVQNIEVSRKLTLTDDQIVSLIFISEN